MTPSSILSADLSPWFPYPQFMSYEYDTASRVSLYPQLILSIRPFCLDLISRLLQRITGIGSSLSPHSHPTTPDTMLWPARLICC